MQVEIDIFSGRPNPLWVPAPEESRSLEDGLLREAETDCGDEPDALGYKGFILTIKRSDTHSEVEQVRVYNGKLWYLNHTRRCFKDTQQLEKQLLQQARQKGFAGLLDSLQM